MRSASSLLRIFSAFSRDVSFASRRCSASLLPVSALALFSSAVLRRFSSPCLACSALSRAVSAVVRSCSEVIRPSSASCLAVSAALRSASASATSAAMSVAGLRRKAYQSASVPVLPSLSHTSYAESPGLPMSTLLCRLTIKSSNSTSSSLSSQECATSMNAWSAQTVLRGAPSVASSSITALAPVMRCMEAG